VISLWEMNCLFLIEVPLLNLQFFLKSFSLGVLTGFKDFVSRLLVFSANLASDSDSLSAMILDFSIVYKLIAQKYSGDISPHLSETHKFLSGIHEKELFILSYRSVGEHLIDAESLKAMQQNCNLNHQASPSFNIFITLLPGIAIKKTGVQAS